ncbi:hypothetical protein [Halococcus thailandensis]|uniref:Uncharacterized protein n=1 Tax=Halococcus thailandensis JCM 13552 TaxID=1227457 RepID=M0NFF3_9EURY|nr:hypothetical protein [Halococcus thailandensis]EMA56556.1 hypothetical protein C451_01718 [Halococcus thailandensis JCM 13552]
MVNMDTTGNIVGGVVFFVATVLLAFDVVQIDILSDTYIYGLMILSVLVIGLGIWNLTHSEQGENNPAN